MSISSVPPPPSDNSNKKLTDGGGAIRHDANKAPLELISPIAMIGLAKVLGKGAKKYAPHNWRKGMNWSRCIGSLKRHLAAFEMGLDYDVDPNCQGCVSNNCTNHTGELHIDQVLCNAMFLSEYARTHNELDDRHKVLDTALELTTLNKKA